MATIRQRKGKWQVQVRRQDQPTNSRTFILKADAQRWAKQAEAEADRRRTGNDPSILRKVTLGDVLRRFRDEVCPQRRSVAFENAIINAFLRNDLATRKLDRVTPEGFAAYRDERLKRIKPATINRELGLIQRILEVARQEWGIPLVENPVKAIRKAKADNARDRRLRSGEWDSLLKATEATRNRYLEPLVKLALATGMRRGELLNARWADVHWKDSTLLIPQTKNGEPRTIPLTDEAKHIIGGLGMIHHANDKIVPISAEAAKLGWKRLARRAAITDLHFHDLRHEAISRFFELGLTVPEVALISGHKDPRMLFRYTHLKAETVARKLNAPR